MTLTEKNMAGGFNAGYVIEKYQPELSQSIVKAIIRGRYPIYQRLRCWCRRIL